MAERKRSAESPQLLEPQPPTLDEAFFVLCRAMEAHLLDDVPGMTHCQEIQVWATNGGRENMHQAWAHAVQILEGILGVPLVGR